MVAHEEVGAVSTWSGKPGEPLTARELDDLHARNADDRICCNIRDQGLVDSLIAMARASLRTDASALAVVIAEAEARGAARGELQALESIRNECRGALAGSSDGGTYYTQPPDLMRLQRRIDNLRARTQETTDAG